MFLSLNGEVENTGIDGEVELDADDLVSGLAVIVGGRYEIDDRSRSSFDGTGAALVEGVFSEQVFLPKLALRYDLDDRTSIGYGYSEGWQGAWT